MTVLMILLSVFCLIQSSPSTQQADATRQFEEWWYRQGEKPSAAAVQAIRDAASTDAEAKIWLAVAADRELTEEPVDKLRLIRESAEEGVALAQVQRAVLSVDGSVSDLSGAEALALLEEAFTKGSPDAALQLGDLYLNGRGVVEPDLVRADEYFEKARRRGMKHDYVKAAYIKRKLGDMAESGLLLEEGARIGDADAQAVLVRSLMRGDHMMKDLERAVSLAREWSGENMEVAGLLGLIYSEAPEDYDVSGMEIIRLLNTGAKVRDREVSLALADALIYGIADFEPHPEIALQVLGKLAEADDAEAEFRLARLYLEGVVVDRDVNRAVALLESAADRGHRRASGLLAQIRERDASRL